MNRRRERTFAVLVVGALILAVLADLTCAAARQWFAEHSLTTNLLASAVFAGAVYFAIEQAARRREASRWVTPAREALDRIVRASQRATKELDELIRDRSPELVVGSSEESSSTEEDRPPGFAVLFNGEGRRRITEIARRLRAILDIDPQWLGTVLAPRANVLSEQASERIVAAGPVLALVDDPDALEWVSQDATALRSVATAAAFISELMLPREVESGPMLKALDDQMRRLAPSLEGEVGDFVRRAIADEGLIRGWSEAERLETLTTSIDQISYLLVLRQAAPSAATAASTRDRLP